MIYPLFILGVSRIEIRLGMKFSLSELNIPYVFQEQIPVTCFTTRFSEPESLPAYKHNSVGRCPADAVGMHDARKRLTFHRNPANPAVFRCLPQQFCNLFHHL